MRARHHVQVERANHIDTMIRRFANNNDPTTSYSIIPNDIPNGISTTFAGTSDNYILHNTGECFQEDLSTLPCLSPSHQRGPTDQFEAIDIPNLYGAPDMHAIMGLTTSEEDAAQLAYTVDRANLLNMDLMAWDGAAELKIPLANAANFALWQEEGIASLWDPIPAL